MYINTSKLKYNAGLKQFFIAYPELFKLNAKGEKPIIHQLRPDSIDLGLVLISHKTGGTVEFVLDLYYMKNSNGSYKFVPRKSEIENNPALNVISLIVYRTII